LLSIGFDLFLPHLWFRFSLRRSVGLTAALEAKRLGLSVKIIDRKTQRSVHDSRAIVVHPRVMELIQPLGGVTTKIAESAFQIQGMSAYIPDFFGWLPGCGGYLGNSGEDSSSTSTSKYDHEAVKLDMTNVVWGDTEFPNLYFLPQYETERILEEALAAEGVRVSYGVALDDLKQDNGVVTTTLRNVEIDTTQQPLVSRWVLGADGGRSKTRDLIGVELTRHSFGLYFVIADLVLKGDDIPLASHEPGKGGHFWPSGGPVAFLPLPGKNAYRVAGRAPQGITSKDQVELNEKFFTEWLLERTGKKFEIELGQWQTIFEITHGSTDSYRKNNVMLAGDASHVHSPVGGQGMNLGMQDANNLLWKLAWSKRILKASASEEDYVKANEVVDIVLGTYNSERHSLGKDLVKQVEFATKMISIENSFVKLVRDAFLKLLLPSNIATQNFRKIGQLEQAYPTSSSAFLFENPSWTAHYICSPGQRLPNIRLDDGSHLYSHVDRTRHTWVILNNDTLEAPVSLCGAKVARVKASEFETQVSVPAISETAYAASQVLLVRPDQFVAGVASDTETLMEELRKAGLTDVALATM